MPNKNPTFPLTCRLKHRYSSKATHSFLPRQFQPLGHPTFTLSSAPTGRLLSLALIRRRWTIFFLNITHRNVRNDKLLCSAGILRLQDRSFPRAITRCIFPHKIDQNTALKSQILDQLFVTPWDSLRSLICIDKLERLVLRND